MAPRYYRVGPTIWSQPWSDDARMLAVYLLTCEHRITEGLYRLPLAYAAADLGWDTERLRQPFAELLADGFIEYDEEAKLVLIVNALEYQAPANPNGVKAAVKAVAEFTKSALYGRFLTEAERLCEPLAKQLTERYGQPVANTPSPSPSPINSTLVEPVGPDPETAEAAKASPAVKALCRLLADDIRRRDQKFAADQKAMSAGWLKEMRLLVADRGGDDAEVERILRWTLADSFWQGVVLSPAKLRKQFTQLLGRAGPQLTSIPGGPPVVDVAARDAANRAANADWVERFNATAPGRKPAA